MRKFTAFVIAMFISASVAQAALVGTFSADKTNVAATDGVNSIQVDSYIVNIENTSADPLLAVEMTFEGDFFHISGQDNLFRTTAEMPTFFGQNIPDSFFVGTGTQLVGSSTDAGTTLFAAWTYPQSAPIIEGNSTTALAYLVVPTGSIPTFTTGRGTYDLTSYEDVTVTPIGGGEDGLAGEYVGPGASLSEGLQGAFASSNGGPIVLNDAIMLSNTNSAGSLGDLAPISALVVLGADTGNDFATATVTDTDGDGKYDIMIDADWSSLDPGQVLAGEIAFSTSAAGADPNAVGFGFSIAVPEPSTVALSCLALVGLVGFARRK